VRGGSEAQLLAGLQSSKDPQAIQEFLAGLRSKRRLTDATLSELAQLHFDSAEHRSLICQIVCKSDHARAKPLLSDLGRRDPLSFFQCLHWYARDKISEWQDVIISLADGIADEETFRFFTYVLEPLPVDRAVYLIPFTRSKEGGIRQQAFYALGSAENRHRHLASFFLGLDDPDSHVVRVTLQALEGLKDRSLLPHYQKLVRRFPEERDHVLSNLSRRLAEFGLSRSDLMQIGSPLDVCQDGIRSPRAGERVRRALRRFYGKLGLRINDS